ncbi:hypothetical protein HK102_004616, partial [Quaeritorhiza haematococci]
VSRLLPRFSQATTLLFWITGLAGIGLEMWFDQAKRLMRIYGKSFIVEKVKIYFPESRIYQTSTFQPLPLMDNPPDFALTIYLAILPILSILTYLVFVLRNHTTKNPLASFAYHRFRTDSDVVRERALNRACMAKVVAWGVGFVAFVGVVWAGVIMRGGINLRGSGSGNEGVVAWGGVSGGKSGGGDIVWAIGMVVGSLQFILCLSSILLLHRTIETHLSKSAPYSMQRKGSFTFHQQQQHPVTSASGVEDPNRNKMNGDVFVVRLDCSPGTPVGGLQIRTQGLMGGREGGVQPPSPVASVESGSESISVLLR